MIRIDSHVVATGCIQIWNIAIYCNIFLSVYQSKLYESYCLCYTVWFILYDSYSMCHAVWVMLIMNESCISGNDCNFSMWRNCATLYTTSMDSKKFWQRNFDSIIRFVINISHFYYESNDRIGIPKYRNKIGIKFESNLLCEQEFNNRLSPRLKHFMGW